jgi:hypothetical protein
MKLLNLDDIAVDSQRVITYKGVQYKVRDFTVSEFIQFQKHFNAFTRYYNSTKEEDMPMVVIATKSLVEIGVPEFPLDEVDNLNPVQMLAVVSMIANLMPEADEETQAEMVEASPKADEPAAG